MESNNVFFFRGSNDDLGSQDLDATDLGGVISWQSSDDRLVDHYAT